MSILGLGIGLPTCILIVFLILLDYLTFFATASPVHHIRRWHHSRFHDGDEIKPVPFVGRMTEIDQLNPENRSKILQGLHSFMVKHSKPMGGDSQATLPGMEIGKRPSTVVVPAKIKDEVPSERMNYSRKIANDLAEKQLQKLNKVITPQLDVLKKKGISAAAEN